LVIIEHYLALKTTSSSTYQAQMVLFTEYKIILTNWIISNLPFIICILFIII
jgi:hypothetical protein